MQCPDCRQPFHMSRLGVGVCLRCGHISQPIISASTPGTTRGVMRSIKRSIHRLPLAFVVLGIVICILGASDGVMLTMLKLRGAGSTTAQTEQTPVKESAKSPATAQTSIAKPTTPSSSITAKTQPAAPKVVVTPPDTKAQPTPAPAVITPPSYVITNNLCQVDASQAPEFFDRAKDMAAVCQTVFPQIEALLTPSPYAPLHRIVLDHNQYAAYAQYGLVHVSIDWLQNSPYDPGVIPHELTHVVQSYDGTAPSWLTEGIATYMSYKLKYSIGVAHCNADESYQSGYGCAASLLNYTERVYRPTIVKDVHLSLKNDSYSDNLFQTETGRSLSQLYSECLQAECKGGTL